MSYFFCTFAIDKRYSASTFDGHRLKFQVMANKKNEVVNVTTTKSKIETSEDVSVRERTAAYLVLHAVEHYCTANGVEEEEVKNLLSSCEKEKFVYWVYTTPKLDGVNSKGQIVTEEIWQKSNPDAIRCDILDSVQWYKKPVMIENALSICRILSSLSRYNEAKEKGTEKYIKKLREELADAAINDDMEKFDSIKKEIKKLTEKK